MALNRSRDFCANFAQLLRNTTTDFAPPKLCLGKMSDGKFPVLDQHHRCGYHGRQLGRSGVTRACLPRKENSVRHQIRFHSVVGASFHQRNLAAFSSAALASLDLAVTSRDGSGDVDG